MIVLMFHRQILTLLNCPQQVFASADHYMLITIAGLPFIFGYNAIRSILQGMGESKVPMIFICFSAAANVILDILFVIFLHLGVEGTAFATVIGQGIAFFAAAFYVYGKKEQFHLKLTRSFFTIDIENLKIICAFGIPQAIRSFLVRISLLWVNSGINAYGITYSATNSIGNKQQKMLDVFTSSLSQASAAMIGQNLGAKKYSRAGKIVWYTLYIGLTVAAIIIAVTMTFSTEIFSIFSTDREVLELGRIYMKIMAVHYLWCAVITPFQAMVIGSGFSSMNFLIGLLDGILCKIGLSILFVHVLHFGAEGFSIGIAWSRALPAVICFVYFISGKWKKRRLLSE